MEQVGALIIMCAHNHAMLGIIWHLSVQCVQMGFTKTRWVRLPAKGVMKDNTRTRLHSLRVQGVPKGKFGDQTGQTSVSSCQWCDGYQDQTGQATCKTCPGGFAPITIIGKLVAVPQGTMEPVVKLVCRGNSKMVLDSHHAKIV